MPFRTYIISDGTAIKIGKTNTSFSLRKRLIRLQTGNPRTLRLIGGFNKDIETNLHREFKAFRLYGEWFENSIIFKIMEKEGFLHKRDFKGCLYLNNHLFVSFREQPQKV